MSPPADFLRAILKGVLAIVVLASILVGVLIAWWIAALVIAGWLVYAGVRGLFGVKRHTAAREEGPLTIEGEYRIEQESLGDALRDTDEHTHTTRH